MALEMTQEIKENHRRLSDVNLTFLDYVRQHPDCLKRANFDDLNYTKELVFQPWPTFVSPQTRRCFEDASVKVYKLIKHSLSRFFQMDPRRIGRYLEMAPEMVEYILCGVTDAHLDNLIGRGDFVLNASGVPKCVEFNVAANLGGWELHVWENRTRRNPYIAEFLKQSGVRVVNESLLTILMEHIIDSVIASQPEPPAELNIAILFRPPEAGGAPLKQVSSSQGGLNPVYAHLLKSRFGINKGAVIPCFSRDLRAQGDCIYLDQKKIHAVLEYQFEDTSPLISSAFVRGNLLVFNGAVSALLTNKLIPALLSENEDSPLLTPDERETIRTYVPWTRKTADGEAVYRGETINLKEFVLANRDTMVLKAAVGYGGMDVLVGRHTDDHRWRAAVQRAFTERAWVVQEFVPSAVYMYQNGEEGAGLHHTTWGFFVFGNRYAGAWMRVLPVAKKQAVINADDDAATSVILEVSG